MPLGIICNGLAIVTGGILGATAGHRLKPEFKEQMNLVFGVCSMGMGISSIVLMKNMPAVIFALVVGTVLGMAIHLGLWINRGAALMQKPIAKCFGSGNGSMTEEEFLEQLVTVIVLFCASGTGIYGSLTAGMTGDHSVLISKSILDFFTAAIFACNLGYVISVISIPQCTIFFLLFMAAGMIYPLTVPEMIDDFKACGGFLMLATGFRMIRLKQFPTADMILAMVLVMPLSYAWMFWIMPLL